MPGKFGGHYHLTEGTRANKQGILHTETRKNRQRREIQISAWVGGNAVKIQTLFPRGKSQGALWTQIPADQPPICSSKHKCTAC